MNHVALCDRMKVNYLELNSDDMPGYVIEDYREVMEAEYNAAEEQRRKDAREARKRGRKK